MTKPRYIAADSEFNDAGVLCFVFADDVQEWRFDTRHGADDLAEWLAANTNATFLAYNIRAEIKALVRLGLTVPERWIDLLPECVMLTTHERLLQTAVGEDGRTYRYQPKRIGLTEASRLIVGRAMDAFIKKEMYGLILSQTVWSADQFATILDYCAEDTAALLPLWEAIQTFHASERSPWTVREARWRGTVIRAAVMMQCQNAGMPVDPTWLQTVYDNREAILTRMVDELRPIYDGLELYQMVDGRARVNEADCREYARRHGLPWKLTAKSGRLTMQGDYLDDFTKSCPSLKAFKTLRDLERNLSKNRWLDGDAKTYQPPLIQAGHVFCDVVASATVTGRSKMLTGEGHVMNAPPLFRTMIAPPPGRVIIGCDWSQQEIALALTFFPDARLRQAFETIPPGGTKRDIYTNLALMAGAILPGMSAAERALIRQQFKAVQLGLSYGMGAAALGRKLFADLNAGLDHVVISREEADRRAQTILRWHKRTFRDYWRGVERFERSVRRAGHYKGVDGWVYFVHRQTSSMQLQNLKMQLNGAAMMRLAIKGCADAGLEFVCEHHDAIYVTSDEADAETVAAELRAIMDRASSKVTGGAIDIQIDAKIVRHGEHWADPRAAAIVQMINDNLETVERKAA